MITMDLSGSKPINELAPMKTGYYKSGPYPNQCVNTVMDTAEELAHNSESRTNRIIRTPMLPLVYGSLVKGENMQ